MILGNSNFFNKRPIDREDYTAFYYGSISLVQDLVDSILLQLHYKNESYEKTTIKFSMMPSKCLEKPKLFIFYGYTVPILFTVVQIPALAYMLFYLSNEKDNHIIKYLSLIDIHPTMYLLQNRVIDFILTIIPNIPVIIIFKHSGLIRYSSFTLIFIYLLAVLFSSNCLFMLWASIFKHQSVGMVVGFTLLLMGSVVSVRLKMDIFIPYTIVHHILVI